MTNEELWERAQSEPVGLAVKTNDPALLRQQLYKIISEEFSLRISEDGTELCIIRKAYAELR